jgi:Mor family transcriptional regulator
MSQLVDALGQRAVARLAPLVGGRQIRIPTMSNEPASLGARRRLIALVGGDLAADLITFFGGTRIYFPSGPSEHNSRANPIDVRVVAKLTKRGKSAAHIAAKLGCSERCVFKIRAQRKTKP